MLAWVFTVDMDPDHFDPSLAAESDGLSWRGVEEGIPRLLRALGGLDPELRVTWFVRADDQVHHYHGSADWLVREHENFLRTRIAKGDEVALHPHLYRRQGSDWVQERDSSRLAGQLRRAHAAVTDCGFDLRSSRIGESYQSAALIAALEDLGIRSDSTAMPGRVREDEHRTIDWGPTPPRPYWPDAEDHRRPGSRRGLLEMPMSMLRTRARHDAAPLMRYLDPTFRSEVLAPGLPDLLETAPLLVSVLHPVALLADAGPADHPLLSFDLTEAVRNVEGVRSAARDAGRELRFLTLNQAREWWISTLPH